MYWVGNAWDKQLGADIAKIIQQEVIEKGLGRKDAARVLEQIIGQQFPEKSRGYWEIVASAGVVRARNFGSIESYVQASATTYLILEVGDARTCDTCNYMNGKEFTVSHATAMRDSFLAAESPEAAKAAHPWVSFGDVKGKSAGELVGVGVMLPPFHGRCRGTTVVGEFSDSATVTTAAKSESTELPILALPPKHSNPEDVPGIASQPEGSREREIRETEYYEMAHLKQERGIIYDHDGSVLVDKMGGDRSIELERDDLKDRTFTHNHPRGTGPSPADVLNVAVDANAKEVRLTSRVPTSDGSSKTYLHRFQRPVEGWPPQSEVAAKMRNHEIRVRKRLAKMTDREEITTDEAARMKWHEVWKRVAGDLDIGYIRIEMD
jgi:hypothetical protein